ncbi:solute carrier family 35 member F6 [Exaiptasia diaphana]|uniref:Solute carrier family 35 member F6 n=1 Tax=Exaiptasia diaphana TaxID=2652724 RepID=A0A913XWA7_EXADI|nr:solute carrier family 35 member F6 [Exaiptasia diaphana]KXJ24479.1 Solute carrier family 35 member F6 [Exaiptasia diaphana]
MMAVLSCTQILLALGMLISGSINTLSKKAQNDCSSKGLKDTHGNEVHKFDHPWFQTGLMFIGETMCLIGLFFYRRRLRNNARKNLMDINRGSSDGSELSSELTQQPRVFQWIFAFPTVCDLFGTTLGGIGLLYVNASVWQMLRGSIIIFTGILSKIFLKRKLWPIHWIGMIVTMFGLVLVGLSSVLRDNHQGSSQGEVILGIALILGGQCVSATQMIVEELFLKKRGYHPLQVVGMEGFFGIILMACLVLPVLYYIPGDQNNHSYENSIDALLMIKNDTKLLIMSLLYICSISFYNFFGLSVTKSLTAVHRTLIDACRTIVVWAVDLFVHYVFHEGFGEAWDKKYGIFQVDGFLFLLLGTALYNELMIIPPLMPKPEPSLHVQAPDSHPYDIQDESKPLLNDQPESTYTAIV